jgi:hypothetical protein
MVVESDKADMDVEAFEDGINFDSANSQKMSGHFDAHTTSFQRLSHHFPLKW